MLQTKNVYIWEPLPLPFVFNFFVCAFFAPFLSLFNFSDISFTPLLSLSSFLMFLSLSLPTQLSTCFLSLLSLSPLSDAFFFFFLLLWRSLFSCFFSPFLTLPSLLCPLKYSSLQCSLTLTVRTSVPLPRGGVAVLLLFFLP